MNQKSLSVQNKTHKKILSFIKNQKISKVYDEFSSSLGVRRNLAVAVSGGPDSLALAYLAKKANVKLSGPPETATAKFSLTFKEFSNSLNVFNIFLLLRWLRIFL